MSVKNIYEGSEFKKNEVCKLRKDTNY